MVPKVLLLAAPLVLLAHARPAALELQKRILLDPICTRIDNATSSATSVHYPGDLRYDNDISHWASSSTQLAKCSVRPGTATDVGIILGIVGSTGTPFAVKGGGHASNPGFSSTPGVLIAMSRFSEVTYDAASQTAVVGAGLIWDDVYAALAPHNVNVVGGRVTGVGVAGFTLGGGYSWLTNQRGLTIDTVTAFELVKPSGEVVNVTQNSDPELFFGLKGGMNNFGVVTRFTLQTFPQGQVWGGLITYTFPHLPDVAAATANFAASVTDLKASIITTYNFLLGQPGVSQLLFYDGPSPPSGIFDDFLAIPHLTMDVSARDFLSLVKSSPANSTYGQRGIFNSVSLTQYTPTILDAILNETVFWGSHLSFDTGVFISYDVEPFLPSLFSHGAASSSAYPPARGTGLLPLNIYYAWSLELSDDKFHEAARQSAARIKDLAIAEGQDIVDAAVYPNYAIYDTPLVGLYGGNVPALQALKARVDPQNVMNLAGGFRL
ncbi:putative oxygen-dependent FAD-linked oxidoreductase family protein [Lyophyllum shimeji]|uniref:Oxygen-dependent FAD-linked oxidoreductase family protein n=1 Tax=Lyophyllum shimeji TaxID=47721 RepID=A0A9P3PWK7_LYOSH|nr:putative oxygen-dependent FAD-linked oxidoreductase family protein [Lyophyllum shimeji]